MKDSVQMWERHLAAAHQEKLSTRAYAKKHGLSLSALYYWQRKLQGAAKLRTSANPINHVNQASKFLTLRVAHVDPVVTQRPGSCTLVLGGGIRLEMSALPDPRWVAELGRAAQGAC